MDTQTFINILMSLVAFFGGFFVKSLKDSVDQLRQEDTLLAIKVQEIEVLVAGQYVKRDEWDRMVQALFAKLDKISDQINTKADK